MTPAGIEPATFRFVAQHLNHCATSAPTFFLRFSNSALRRQYTCRILNNLLAAPDVLTIVTVACIVSLTQNRNWNILIFSLSFVHFSVLLHCCLSPLHSVMSVRRLALYHVRYKSLVSSWSVQFLSGASYRYASLNDGDTFWEMLR